jgi:hypothetical protein
MIEDCPRYFVAENTWGRELLLTLDNMKIGVTDAAG